MNKFLLLILTTVFAYPHILMAIPEPEKDLTTVFNYDHVQLFFHNRFAWNSDDKRETLTYEKYISDRTGCRKFTIIGMSRDRHNSMTIMIDCHDLTKD